MWVVYGLVDPLEPDRIRYVGKTCDPAHRLAQHIQSGFSEYGIKGRWIAELLGDRRYPNMVLLEVCGAESTGRELHWYCELRCRGEADLNINQPMNGPDFPYPTRTLLLSPQSRRHVELCLKHPKRRVHALQGAR